MKNALIGLLASTWIAACHSSPGTSEGLPFRSIARGYQTGLAKKGVLVAHDDGEWRALWSRHAASVIPRPDLPSVDFGTDMVVCVMLGTCPTFGYAIEVTRVVPDGDRGVCVEVVERAPIAGEITSQVVTQPFHMIATPRRAGGVRVVAR